MNVKLKGIILIVVLLFIVDNGYSINRWFKISPGFRLIGMAVDMDSRVPSNGTTTRFDFGFGANFDFQLEKSIGLDIDVLYLRKGADVSGGSRITLHYISVPTLVKLYLVRKKIAFVFGPVHNFLIGVKGRLSNPNVELNMSNTNKYDLGIAFGLSYVMADLGDGMKLVGAFRFEFGLINVFGGHRPELFNRTTPYFGIGLNF